MIHIYKLILLITCLLPLNCFAEQSPIIRYNITYTTIEDGLSSNFIDDIYKDTRGFLWLSTAGGGLSRYDGHEFVCYDTNSTPASIKSNFVRMAVEDDYGRLWIISEGGVDILDIAANKTIDITDHTGRTSGIWNKQSICVRKDTKGNIWLISGADICKICFNEKGEIFRLYRVENILPDVSIVAMADCNESGDMWTGVGNNIYVFKESKDGVLKAGIISEVLTEFTSNIVTTIRSSGNDIWIGTDAGLYRYNIHNDHIKAYNHKPGDINSLSQDYITDIISSDDNQIYVSTYRGINHYNPITDSFSRINQCDNTTGNNLNCDFVNCGLASENIVWIGTEAGGLNKIKFSELTFINYINDRNDCNSIAPNPVNSIYEDRNGNLWVGTVESGLSLKRKGSNHFSHYTQNSSTGLCHNSVSYIISDKADKLWIGTWGGGISVIDINRPDRPALNISEQNTNGAKINFVGVLSHDTINNLMWIGANQGIYAYDTDKKTIINPLGADTEKVKGAIGSSIDKKGRLWIGSNDGLFIIDLTKNEGGIFGYTHLRYKLDKPESNLIEKVTCVCNTRDGDIVVGSNGYGFYRMVSDTDDNFIFENINIRDGLCSNSVRGIVEDNRGYLWITTNSGLSIYNPDNHIFRNYGKEDGLFCTQFYWNAYCPRVVNNNIYLGTTDGLISLSTDVRENAKTTEKVTITRLKILNKEVYKDDEHLFSDISSPGELILHERDKYFTIEFATLNYEGNRSRLYSYRLKGFDNTWITLAENRRFASFTNLRPGKYTFQVRYGSDIRNESAEITELDIIIKPFFYKTAWFVALVICLIMFVVWQLYKWKVSILHKQKELLHNKVIERTAELSRQNAMLVSQNEKITRQKQQLIDMSNKVQEATIDKLTFFTNITHEFRTPITLIIGPIERALKLSTNPQVIEQLNFVDRNSKYLLSLVNQLMTFRKVESGKIDIVKSPGNILNFLDTLIIPFEVFAGERNITIKKCYRLASPDIYFDEDAMRKVMDNLLSNAIKFTPDNGLVTIYVALLNMNGTTRLYISVSDNGCGIAEEDLQKIFNRFYQSVNHSKYPVYGQSGTGIGLYLCRRIVMMHGGRIQARNNRAKGCTFRLDIPVEISDVVESQEDKSSDMIINSLIREDSASEGRLNILVVEDNRDMREFIRSILEEHYITFEASNGREALAVLSLHNIDFIISDLMMPEMDGIELSKKVKENFSISHIPFLMLTAKTSHDSRMESYRMGVDDYILKPFNEEELLLRIENILANKKRYQQKFSYNMDVDILKIEEDSTDKKFMDKAMDILRDNYGNSCYEISDFVDAMGVSKSLLNKKLQNLTGQSAGQFIRNYRLNLAKELIIKNRVKKNMNISEIAYEVGFNDPKYFTRCFTKHFSMTPSSLLE